MATISGWSDGLPFALWRAHTALHRRVIDAISGLGVTVTQLGLAVHLDELGRMSASDLARMFRLTPQSVTTALGHLERLGWVVRHPHPVHKRVIWYELTPVGQQGIAEGRARLADVSGYVAGLIGDDVRDELIRDLRGLAVAIDGPEAPAGPLWPVFEGS